VIRSSLDVGKEKAMKEAEDCLRAMIAARATLTFSEAKLKPKPDTRLTPEGE
jgi:hypothetical protein